ncbi:MAG: C1 family peptidase [Candidatus Ancillula sp.]|nr:C1 family peptidase [Candidatus Ancillula sp.]
MWYNRGIEIRLDDIASFRSEFENDTFARTLQNAIVENGVDAVALDAKMANSAMQSRSAVQVRLDNWGATSQKQSGRCWLFSSLNLIRFNMSKNLEYTSSAERQNGGKSFELSQNYAMFWDKFERANYFLQSVLSLHRSSLFFEPDGITLTRESSFLLQSLLGDGGQWNMAVNVYKKYGVVPKDAMPETVSSSSTLRMNTILRTLLRKRASEVVKEGVDAKNIVHQTLRDVYRILALHLGTPPSQFDFQWRKDSGGFAKVSKITGVEFMKQFLTLNLEDYVCLVDDPREHHRKNTSISIEHLGNVLEGDKVLYLNSDTQTMKRLTVDALQGNGQLEAEPVWMGCDVKPQMLRSLGLWGSELFRYSDVHGVDLSSTKGQRVSFQDSAMTHAMLFTGVDLDESGIPWRWRVENSWGEDSGDKGFYTMLDSWFDEYMFEVAVHKSLLTPELRAAYEKYLSSGEFDYILPAWDPMGALA